MKQSKLRVGLLLMLLSLFLAACGSLSSPPDVVDKIAPTLSSSLPTEGASAVPINAKLGFAFNEAMDEGSIELTANPAITLGTPTWNTASTSVVFDNSNLATSTAYTLSVKANDVSGNALAPTTIAFTTSDSADTTAPSTPTGLIATPANGQVTLTWQDNPEVDVVGYTLYMGTAQDKLKSQGFVVTTSKVVTGLTNDTKYFFAVDAVDGANNHSEQTTPVSATPSVSVADSNPPTIQSSDPTDNATDVTGEFVFSIVFSEPIDTSSLKVVLDPAEYALELISWSNNDTMLTLSPLQLHLFEQKENTPYKLTINAKDKAGNVLSGDTAITFTTGFEVPTLVSSTPANGAINVEASLLKAQVITLTFSEAVKPETFQTTTNFPYPCGPVWGTGNITVSFFCLLNDSNSYNFSYEGQDLDGHAFEGSINFSTASDTAPPSVFTTSPTDLKVNVPLATPIEISFDDEMDETSTLAAVSSLPDVGCTWTLNITKDTLKCSPTNLQGNTTYTIIVAETAKDTSGKNLVGAGVCRGTPPCSYEFVFSTIVTATTGSLGLNISGAPNGLAKVRVTGPTGFSSGNLGSSTTLSDLEPGTYTVTAQGFATGQLGKPTCKIYTPEPATQTTTVSAGQTSTASVSYSFEPCSDLDP